ncbi:MAG: BMP family ABC transporter substrate-binding protein [Clostridia bacterium]|nr:BMP family ABC transporter substrate-binding protein [Clostridia bacterium]
MNNVNPEKTSATQTENKKSIIDELLAKLPTGKKLIALIAVVAVIIIAAIVVPVVACNCGGNNYTVSDGHEIVFLNANSSIKDQSINEMTWKAVEDFSAKKGFSCNNLTVENFDTSRYGDTIDISVAMGANVIVTAGPFFNQVIYDAQSKYPSVMFLMIDGQPTSADGDVEIGSNVYCIDYDEVQGGYIAGYCAVMDGYRKLGYVGGYEENSNCVRYGYGFLRGANAAAEELGVTGEVSVKYWYSQKYKPDSSIADTVSQWYNDGTEVVFTAGGVHVSVNTAAESTGNFFIGADANLYENTEWYSVLTSVEKPLYEDTTNALTMLYDNSRKWSRRIGGTVSIKGAAEGGIALSTAGVEFETTSSDTSWFFKNYTVDQYKSFLSDVKAGKVSIDRSIANEPVVSITVERAYTGE